MTNVTIKHLWQAEDYHHHSSVQNEAAIQLLGKIQLKGHEQILDVGCGDGKITAQIAKHVQNGFVIGIDTSPQMIDFACKAFPKDLYPNLIFLQQDAQQFNYHTKLDVIFSSFALQWLPNPVLFFKCAYESLKFGGYIAATIPLGISEALERAIKMITSLPKWLSYFQTYSPNWHFLPDSEYKHMLLKNHLMLTQFSVVSQTVFFSSRGDFEKYVIQWLSYLQPLPKHLRRIFFKQVIDKYLDISPALEDGRVRFSFLRLDLIAEKANL